MVTDVHSDKNLKVAQSLTARSGVPGFAKIAEYVVDQPKPEGSVSYADRENKLFPCHTKEATLVSFAYFVDQADQYDAVRRTKVAEQFKAKLAFWNLEDAATEIVDSISAADAPKYALKVASHEMFGYTDGPSIVKAAQAFYDNRHKFPFEMRMKAARHFIVEGEKLAAAYPNDVVRLLEKCAVWAVPSADGLVSVVASRAIDMKNSEQLHKLASAVKVIVEDPTNLYDNVKVAAFLDAVDAYDRLNKLTDSYVSYGVPEEVCFEEDTAKIASDLASTVRLTNGQEINLTDDFFRKLASADPDLAKSIMGDREKARDILPTLPRPDADYLIETCVK